MAQSLTPRRRPDQAAGEFQPSRQPQSDNRSRTIPEPEHYQLLRILAEYFDEYDGFKGYKARRSGKDLFILLHLCFFPHRTMEDMEKRSAPLRRAIERELPGSTVTIEPAIMEQA